MPQVWAPFHDWVAEAYPTNVAVMWTGGGNPQFTEESIALWERRSLEYAEFVTAFGDAYRARADEICTAAHARLNEELQAAGIEMEVPAGTDRLYLVPIREEDLVAYDGAARRIMGETLPELRAVPPPETVQDDFDHLYGLLEQFAEGEEAFTPTPEWWIRQIELKEPSLAHCTFALPR